MLANSLTLTHEVSREKWYSEPTMAFVVATPRKTFEIRESRSTPAGPRSRTLATFKELDDEVLEKASARAERALDFEQLRQAARRAGAPVASTAVDRAARDLITELAQGHDPDPTLRRMLLGTLDPGHAAESDQAQTRPLTDTARAAAAWLTATPKQRGKALEDLLLLADALPSGSRKGKPLHFPRLRSAPA
jgi:hypothetical protein